MKKRLTKRQLEVMKILWDSERPMVASEIVAANEELNINTVQACLRAMIKNEVIEMAGIVYSGTVLTRSYAPRITKEEYFSSTCENLFGQAQTNSLIASLIDSETSLEELEQLERMINKRKKDLKQKRGK